MQNPVIMRKSFGRKRDSTPNKILNTIRRETTDDSSSMKSCVAWNNANGKRQESHILCRVIDGNLKVETK